MTQKIQVHTLHVGAMDIFLDNMVPLNTTRNGFLIVPGMAPTSADCRPSPNRISKLTLINSSIKIVDI